MNSRLSGIKRTLKIDLQDHPVAFLWGPRKVGKTTLLRQQFPRARFYDLLKTDVKTEFFLKPHLLREELLANPPELVIIDEIQKVPALLDEIHWLIENTKIQFVLCGSSARKLRRGSANLLGGRAWSFELFPLTTQEIPALDLLTAFNHGLIPQHYFMKNPERSLKGYVNEYLQEEIHNEALTRNIPAFARFLDAVAATHGQLVNYSSISNEAGVTAKTVKEYFQILQDTLIGHILEPWRKVKKRRLIETPKFYLFELGLVRSLKGMPLIQKGTEEFGHFFEHFLIEEIRAYLSYREKPQKMFYWRTSTDHEVDLIVGNMELALEFKATAKISTQHTRGLRALLEEHPVKKAMLVCLTEKEFLLENGIHVIGWRTFCKKLWAGELLN